MARGRPIDLAHHIQQLLGERQQHADAVARIDAALEPIRSALQSLGGINGKRGPGRPPKSEAMAAGVAAPAGGRRRRGRGRRGSYATTADQMILALVGQRGGATTQEIKEQWKAEGRGGTADNALSKMVKDRKLRRAALEGQRGSRFMLP